MALKSSFISAASALGLSQPLLQAYDSIFSSEALLNAIPDSEISTFQIPKEEKIGYVFLPLIPGYKTFCLRYCVLGHAFRTIGYEPLILRDDGTLPSRPELAVDSEKQTETVEFCRYRSKKMPEEFGLKTLPISMVLGENFEPLNTDPLDIDQLTSYTKQGLNISDYANASSKKLLKRYSLDLTDPEIRRVYEEFLISGAMLADACQQIIKEYNPKITLVTESSYIQGGIPLEVSVANEVPVYTQGQGYHKGKVIFGRSSNEIPKCNFSDPDLVSKYIKTPLSEEQRSTIDAIMEGRKTGEVTRTQHSPTTSISIDVEADTVVGVFSHLLWDAALEPEQALFTDFFDWLRTTIQAGSQVENTHFVIKAHPAEEIRGTNEGIMDWLDREYPNLPDNFSVLPPDTDVNTYELLCDIDAGVVYASTVGLEMAYSGIPVIVGGYPPYYGSGVAIEPATKSGYRNAIREIKSHDCDDMMKQRAVRFAYFLFVCKQHEFQYLEKVKSSSGRTTIRHEDIVKEGGPYQHIVKQITDEEEVISAECDRMNNV